MFELHVRIKASRGIVKCPGDFGDASIVDTADMNLNLHAISHLFIIEYDSRT